MKEKIYISVLSLLMISSLLIMFFATIGNAWILEPFWNVSFDELLGISSGWYIALVIGSTAVMSISFLLLFNPNLESDPDYDPTDKF